MDQVIDASVIDPTFSQQVAAEPGGERILRCFACGTCTASCPVREVTDRYNPRRIIHMVLLGLKHQVLASDFIWLCSTCYTCQERCPQDVRITDLMHAIKNVAVREGYIPPSYQIQIGLIRDHGRLYDITPFENERRTDLGMPAITERPRDFARILAETGLDAMSEATSERAD
jgi:heterodisulfide reductase subunit C